VHSAFTFAPKMRAVVSSAVAMLLGATAASATESNSLRGSASQAVAEAEEGKTLDALSDVFFSPAEGSEGEKSGPIENSTESWDLSASAEAMQGPRGLGETPAQDAVTQVSELPEATEARDEHASEDTLGLHENVTLDVMVTAALSASTQGCHCSTGELRQCGSRCFSRHGSARIGCITGCLDASHHAHWCSQCYARRSDCTMNHCLNNCAADSYARRCTDCVHSHCGGDCR